MTPTPLPPPDPAAGEDISYADVVTLTAWMAAHGGSTAEEAAYAVEKPWKHRDWIVLAGAGADMPAE